MNVWNAMTARTSVRAYTQEAVEPEKMEKIIQAGNLAPVFGQFHITVLEDPNLLQRIDQVTLDMMKQSGNEFLEKRAATEGYRPLYGAPVLIVLSAPGGNDSHGFNMANVSCAAENMILEAVELGLGTCFVMGPMMAFGDPELAQELCFPEGYIPLVDVLAGYPLEQPAGNSRKRTDNITRL